MKRLRNNAGQFQTMTEEKQMELKEIPEDWLKNKNLNSQRCGHCMMIQVSPSFLHFSDPQCFLNYLQHQLKLICCSLIVRAVRTSAGRGVWVAKETAKGKQLNQNPKKFVISFMIIKKWNLKIQHAITSDSHFASWFHLLNFFPFPVVRIGIGVFRLLLASIMESPGAPTVAYLFS